MELSLDRILIPTLIIGVRVAAVIMFMPLMGSVVVPAPVKAMYSIALTALLVPVSGMHIVAPPVHDWPLLLLRELAIGVAIGVATNYVFEAVQVAGQVLSTQMGLSLVNILDPTTRVDTTVLSLFQNTVAQLIFLQLNVHHWILRALARSLDHLPPAAISIKGAMAGRVLESGSWILLVAVQLAAPVLIATLTADLGLGLLGKAAPQMQLMLIGPALKTLLGLVVLGAAITYWPGVLQGLFARSVTSMEEMLVLAR